MRISFHAKVFAFASDEFQDLLNYTSNRKGKMKRFYLRIYRAYFTKKRLALHLKKSK